jgi:DNA invertase Pin-like site-specific DNA recombinase
MQIHAYLGISTNHQDLDTQKLEIKTYAEAKNLKIDFWQKVKMSSRKNNKDRGIDELLAGLKKNERLIVSELSRLGRSMWELVEIIKEIKAKKIEFHSIKENLILKNGESDISSDTLIFAFSLAAKIERDLISQRTKAGLARAKAEGKKLGNPNLKADITKRIEKADQYAKKLEQTLRAYINEGLTQRQIVDRLNEMGVKTITGCEFKLVSLQRVLNRLNLKTKH